MDAAAQPGGITRGSLIKAGAAAALAVGAGTAGRAIADAHSAAELDGPGIAKARGGGAYLRRSTYQPLVGSTFRVHVPESKPLRVKLVEARALRGPGDAFSLLFRGRRDDVAGGLYRIEHPALGTFELFVNPVGRGVKGLDLEAVINRIAT